MVFLQASFIHLDYLHLLYILRSLNDRLRTRPLIGAVPPIWKTLEPPLLPLHLFNSLFFRTTWVSRCQEGKTSLDLNEARDDAVLGLQWHQLDHMQTICTSLQADNHTNTLPLYFYWPDALHDAQPTVSKHWRHSHIPICKICQFYEIPDIWISYINMTKMQ